MNKLTSERRAAIVRALIEGNLIRATCRMTGAAKGTVTRLLLEVADACVRLHDATVQNVESRRVQCDEIWSYVGCKNRNVPTAKRPESIGDVWTWVALDPDTKLAIAWHVGERDGQAARAFVADLASRLANRVQLSSDAYSAYLTAVEAAFGWAGVDYAMVKKIFANVPASGRYSPPACIGAQKLVVMGSPDERHISTSHVERQNLHMRMQMRRFTRLTNAFSKKVENHIAAVALHFVSYNFCNVHRTLTKARKGIHCTPAMAAGLTDRVWTVADIVALLEGHSHVPAN